MQGKKCLGILAYIDKALAVEVGYNLGLSVPAIPLSSLNGSVPADGNPEQYSSVIVKSSIDRSEALSMAFTVKDSIKTRKIAFLIADGVDENSLEAMQLALTSEGAIVELIAPKLGSISTENNGDLQAKKSFLTAASVFYDAVYVPAGINSSATLEAEPDAVHFLDEAYKHCKAIAFHSDALQVLQATWFGRKIKDVLENCELEEGIFVGNDLNNLSEKFIKAVAQHRFWEREGARKVPA
jgi:catalase